MYSKVTLKNDKFLTENHLFGILLGLDLKFYSNFIEYLYLLERRGKET